MLRLWVGLSDTAHNYPIPFGVGLSFLLDPINNVVWYLIGLIWAIIAGAGITLAVVQWLAYHVAAFALAMALGIPLLWLGARLLRQRDRKMRYWIGVVVIAVAFVVMLVIRSAGLVLALENVAGIPRVAAIVWAAVAWGLSIWSRWARHRQRAQA